MAPQHTNPRNLLQYGVLVTGGALGLPIAPQQQGTGHRQAGLANVQTPALQRHSQFAQAVVHHAHPGIQDGHPDIHADHPVFHDAPIPVVTINSPGKWGPGPSLPKQLQHIGEGFHALLLRVQPEFQHIPSEWLGLVHVALKEAADGLFSKGSNAASGKEVFELVKRKSSSSGGGKKKGGGLDLGTCEVEGSLFTTDQLWTACRAGHADCNRARCQFVCLGLPICWVAAGFLSHFILFTLVDTRTPGKRFALVISGWTLAPAVVSACATWCLYEITVDGGKRCWMRCRSSWPKWTSHLRPARKDELADVDQRHHELVERVIADLPASHQASNRIAGAQV